MRLVVDGFGKFVGRQGGLVVVREGRRVVKKVKPDEIKQVLITGKGCISTDAVELLAANGVDVVFISPSGRIRGRLAHPMVGTARTRREQYAAYLDARGVALAREFVMCKLRNQRVVLTNLAKARRESQPEVSERLIEARGEIGECVEMLGEVEGSRVDEVRDEILGIEGRGSGAYWRALGLVLPEEFGFRGRGTGVDGARGARDMVNAMLNYGYAVLHAECLRAVELAGLDPYAGFLHCDRAGRTSLALDLMEEFRQQVVDRRVIKLVTYGQVKADECELRNFVCRLGEGARRRLLNEILSGLESQTQHDGRNMSYSSVILSQARKIAGFVRGERRVYRGFWQGW